MSRHWPITLHDAVRIVLWDCVSREASIGYISDQINSRRLYIQNGGQVFPEQIFLRAKNYPKIFDLVGRERVIAR